MSERTVAVHAKGVVQGVGYRAFTRDAARRLGITGWVVNRPDGSVEAALHGDGAALAEIVGQMRQGPDGARVDALDLRSVDRGAVDQPPAEAYPF